MLFLRQLEQQNFQLLIQNLYFPVVTLLTQDNANN